MLGDAAGVDDPASLAEAIDRSFGVYVSSRCDNDSLKARSLEFTTDRAVERYAAAFRDILANAIPA